MLICHLEYTKALRCHLQFHSEFIYGYEFARKSNASTEMPFSKLLISKFIENGWQIRKGIMFFYVNWCVPEVNHRRVRVLTHRFCEFFCATQFLRLKPSALCYESETNLLSISICVIDLLLFFLLWRSFAFTNTHHLYQYNLQCNFICSCRLSMHHHTSLLLSCSFSYNSVDLWTETERKYDQ